MAENRKIVVIDLGSSRITAMAAEVADRSVHIIGAEEVKKTDLVRHGIVEQMSGAAFEVNDLLRKLQNSAKIASIDKVFVSVNGKTMKHFKTSVTRAYRNHVDITAKLMAEMEEECKSKFQQSDIAVYDLIPISYDLDGLHLDDPVGKKGYEIVAHYNVVVGNKKIVENIERCFDRTGIQVDDFKPLSLEAIAEVVLSPDDCEDGCALINFGATTTTLGIYLNGALQHLLVVPLGSLNITKDIQELGMAEKVAERLKYKGESMEELIEEPIRIRVPSAIANAEDVLVSTKFLAKIIEARLEEILYPIFEIIKSYQAQLGAGIVITGGGAKLNNILRFIEKKTVMNTRFGDHSQFLSDDTDEGFIDPVYAQITGTFLLVNDFLKEHPVEMVEPDKAKEPKIKKGFKNTFTNLFIKYFDEENKMN